MKQLPPRYAKLLQPALAGLRPYEPETGEARIRLDANESPYPPSAAFRAQVAALAGRIELNRYPDPEASSLHTLIRQHYRAGARARVVLGNGSDELIAMLCTAFAGPGRRRARIAVPEPTFSMYRQISQALGYEVIGVPLDGNFGLDLERFSRVLGRKTPNLVFLASPNNPTGNAYDPEAVSWLIRNSESLVVVDEAYGDYGGRSFAGRVGRDPNLVVLKTLSKVGFAALRLGVALAGAAVAAELEKVRLPYNVSSFSQQVAALYLRRPAEIGRQSRRLVAEREALCQKMRSLGTLEVFPSEANFILFRPLRCRAARLHGRLLREGIRIRNLSRPGPLENALRVTLGTPVQNRAFWKALRRIAE